MKFFSAILIAAILTAGLALKSRAGLADGIEAVVNDSIITYQDVDDATAPVADELRRQYAGDFATFQKKLDDAVKENLEQLVERQMILHEFDITYSNFPESIIDEQLKDYIRSRYGDRVTLMKTLQGEGLTYEKFRQQYRDRFVVDQMRLLKASPEKIVISPHKIEAYYAEHTNDFKVEEQVKLRMIVLNKAAAADAAQTRKLAEEIVAKLNDGASFAQMASVYSQGSQAKEGGEWDWVEKSVLRKELSDVAFTLKPGERSGVIETPDADYIMLVEDRRAQHIKPLNDVRDDIERTLLAQERARLQQQWIDRLKKKTFYRYF